MLTFYQMKFRIGCLSGLLALLGSVFSVAQPWPKLKNASFEGKTGIAVLAQGWTSCGDIYNTPDLAPGVWGVTLPPAHGSTYLHLVCRGIGDFTPTGSYEAIGQRLPDSLRAGQEYCFLADLAFPGRRTGTEPKSPAMLRIWGANDDCSEVELLWTSPPIDHTNWQTYRIRFTPRQSHPVLRLECYFVQEPFYWGGLLIDNIRSEQKAPLLGVANLELCLSDSLYLEPDRSVLAAFGIDIQDAPYRWYDATEHLLSQEKYLKVYAAGRYRLEISDGCTLFRDTVTVTAKECESNLWIPNLITPNGDEQNETFAFRGIAPVGWQLTVIDRWGKQVYRNDDYKQDWTADGLPGGIYYYRLKKLPVSTRSVTGSKKTNPIGGLPGPVGQVLNGWVHVLR